MKKLTAEWLLSTYERLREFYAQRNHNMLVARDLYFLREEAIFCDADGNLIPPAEDEVRVVLPTPLTQVEAFRSLLMTRPPILHVPPSEVKRVHQEQCEAIEKMLWALWQRLDIYGEVLNALWHALVDSVGVLQVVYVPNPPEGYPPLRITALDPYYVYPMPGAYRGQWKYVFSASVRPVGQLYEEWVLGRDQRLREVRLAKSALDGLEETDLVQVLDYWDETYNAIVLVRPTASGAKRPRAVGQEAMFLKPPTEHGYGFLPFVIFYVFELPFRDRGEAMALSVLYPIEGAIRERNRLFSQKLTIHRQHADVIRYSKTAGGKGVEWPRPGSGGEISLDLDEEVGFIPPPEAPRGLDELSAVLEGEIHDASLPPTLLGRYIAQMSGIAMSLVRNPALMRIVFKQQAVERALEQLNEYMLRLVEAFVEQPIYVWGQDKTGQPIEVMLDPKTVNGYYRNHVALSATLPADIPALAAILSAWVQQGIMSRQTARDVAQRVMTELMPQSVEDEAQRVLIETFLTQPEVTMALAMQAAIEAGLDPQLIQIALGKGGAQKTPLTREPTVPGGRRIGRPGAEAAAYQAVPTMPENEEPSVVQTTRDITTAALG